MTNPITTNQTLTSRAIALRWATEGFRNRQLRNQLMADNYCCHAFGCETIAGKDSVNRFVDETLFLGLPDVEQIVEDVIPWDDKVALRLTYRGTHTGPFMGVPPTHRQISVSANMILRIEDGQVTEEWTESNPLTWMAQLGVTQWIPMLSH
ncbi:MAG: ester cyclase [Cyanobacteria bacterium J06632_22]